MTVCMVGWAHTKFGKLENEDIESLIRRVARDAVADACLEATDIDAIFLGHFNCGFSQQDFSASLVLQTDDAFRFKPATRVENACASGSAALYAGHDFLEARRGRFVLIIGAEKMTCTPSDRIGDILLNASYRKEEGNIDGGFAGLFARIAQTYYQRYGDRSDALARIAAKNHRNGVGNPYAQMRKDLGFEFCNTVSDGNPIIAAPLRRTDCSLVSDGAAAVVLADIGVALSRVKAIVFRAAMQANDYLPMSRRDMTRFEGAEAAWRRAFEVTGQQLDDLSFVELHDCFTIAELIAYEAMGLAPLGKGATAIDDGWTEKGGRLPVNPSGGLKSKGHPIGATGVSMHVMAALQLMDEAGDMQVKDATVAGIFNMGGAAVANYVSILERVR